MGSYSINLVIAFGYHLNLPKQYLQHKIGLVGNLQINPTLLQRSEKAISSHCPFPYCPYVVISLQCPKFLKRVLEATCTARALSLSTQALILSTQARAPKAASTLISDCFSTKKILPSSVLTSFS